jgi:hypothetical protein
VTTDLSFTPRAGVSRRAGGTLALLYPLVLIALGVSVGFRGSNDVDGLATAILGAILFLVAAPTTWVFAIDFIEASRFTVITAGALTSLPCVESRELADLAEALCHLLRPLDDAHVRPDGGPSPDRVAIRADLGSWIQDLG